MPNDPFANANKEAEIKAEKEAKAKAEKELKAKAEKEAGIKAEKEAKAEKESKTKAKAEREYDVLLNVKHDGTLYVQGSRIRIADKDIRKTLKKLNAIELYRPDEDDEDDD